MCMTQPRGAGIRTINGGGALLRRRRPLRPQPRRRAAGHAAADRPCARGSGQGRPALVDETDDARAQRAAARRGADGPAPGPHDPGAGAAGAPGRAAEGRRRLVVRACRPPDGRGDQRDARRPGAALDPAGAGRAGGHVAAQRRQRASTRSRAPSPMDWPRPAGACCWPPSAWPSPASRSQPSPSRSATNQKAPSARRSSASWAPRRAAMREGNRRPANGRWKPRNNGIGVLLPWLAGQAGVRSGRDWPELHGGGGVTFTLSSARLLAKLARGEGAPPASATWRPRATTVGMSASARGCIHCLRLNAAST